MKEEYNYAPATYGQKPNMFGGLRVPDSVNPGDPLDKHENIFYWLVCIENKLKESYFSILEGIDNGRQSRQLATTLAKTLVEAEQLLSGLIDGQTDVLGLVEGQGLEFIGAPSGTEPSPESGYEVYVSRSPQKAQLVSLNALDDYIRIEGNTLLIREQSEKVSLRFDEAQSIFETVMLWQKKLNTHDVKVEVGIDQNLRLIIAHRLHGLVHKFAVKTNTGLFSDRLKWISSSAGSDIEAYVGGMPTIGTGNHIYGSPGTAIEGLHLTYTSPLDKAEHPHQAGWVRLKPLFKGIRMSRMAVKSWHNLRLLHASVKDDLRQSDVDSALKCAQNDPHFLLKMSQYIRGLRVSLQQVSYGQHIVFGDKESEPKQQRRVIVELLN